MRVEVDSESASVTKVGARHFLASLLVDMSCRMWWMDWVELEIGGVGDVRSQTRSRPRHQSNDSNHPRRRSNAS